MVPAGPYPTLALVPASAVEIETSDVLNRALVRGNEDEGRWIVGDPVARKHYGREPALSYALGCHRRLRLARAARASVKGFSVTHDYKKRLQKLCHFDPETTKNRVEERDALSNWLGNWCWGPSVSRKNPRKGDFLTELRAKSGNRRLGFQKGKRCRQNTAESSLFISFSAWHSWLQPPARPPNLNHP